MFDFNLKELTVSNRGSTLSIEGIHFTIDDNEFGFAVLGDSGLGKTTIFRSLFSRHVRIWSLHRKFKLSCVHRYNAKEFSSEDILKNKLPLKIGFATQTPFFFNDKSVEENIFKPIDWKGIKYSNEEREKLLYLFDLGDLRKTQMSILSGGQRQLINIVRMLTLKPDVAIIDECFSSMNEEMAHKYISTIKSNYSECIFLITSHRLSDIVYFGSKYVRLRKEIYKSGRYYVTQS